MSRERPPAMIGNRNGKVEPVIQEGCHDIQIDSTRGAPVDGLQMSISARHSSNVDVPKFEVAMRNLGERDVVLNLGMMLANGKVQLPDRIILNLSDARGEHKSSTFSTKGMGRFGRIHSELRAARLKEIAHIVLNEFDGDLTGVLGLPLSRAKRALQKFPSIGAPGAEKILLFTSAHPLLALESNGLRLLLRIVFGKELKNYAATYASVQQALQNQIGNDCDFLINAHQLLLRHGKELCRKTNLIVTYAR